MTNNIETGWVKKRANQFAYSNSDRLNIVRAYQSGDKSMVDIAEEYGVSECSVRRWVKKYGFIAEKPHGFLPENHIVKGVSTLYDENGQKKLEWVKTNQDVEHIQEMLEHAVLAMSEKIPKQDPVKIDDVRFTQNSDLCSVYVITDYHFGQMSSKEEVGEAWDMDVAEKLLVDWFRSAIYLSPCSHTAILCQLGDFLHYDSLNALTPTSSHLLDTNERYGPIVRVIVRVLRQVMDMLLEKHEHVHVVMAEGNHDIASSVWLRVLFANLYGNDPRITVDMSHLPYYGFEWGNTSLFFHHGHKARIGTVSELMAAQFREILGRTKYSYAHMGHYHHRDVKESRLMVVEQHPTLAAKDAHSARGGYHSQRNASVITYSKKFGEVSRVIITPDMVSH